MSAASVNGTLWPTDQPKIRKLKQTAWLNITEFKQTIIIQSTAKLGTPHFIFMTQAEGTVGQTYRLTQRQANRQADWRQDR